MLNLRRTLTSINPYEVQTLSGRLLNRQCLNQKVKAVAQQLVWNSQLQDCNTFRNCWQFYANGQKPVSFVEQQRRKMANRGFVDRIKNPNAAKFLQLFATSELRVQGSNVYDQMYDEFVSCFESPQPGPCPTKKIKRHLPRKSVKVVTAARPATRNEGKKLKPIFKINPALLPQTSKETVTDKRRIRFKVDNIRKKPGIIYKSWISTVGTSADTSRDDSLEMETIEIPREELQKHEKPEGPKTDAKPDKLQQSVKHEGLKANVRIAELLQSGKPEGLKANVGPAKLQHNVKPQGLKANVRPEELPQSVKHEGLKANVQIAELLQSVKPEGLKANVGPAKLQTNVKPQGLKANVLPEELQESVKPDGLNVGLDELQRDVKPQGLKRNVKPKQLKHNVKSVKTKHNVSFEKKLPENSIPETPEPLKPPRTSSVPNISEKDLTNILENEAQRTQKEIELAEIAMLEELARKRRKRLARAHSEPNLKSHSFKHHKHHAKRKKTFVSLRRTDTLKMSSNGSSARSTYTRNMLNFQKQSRLQDLLKFRLSTTPTRYSSQSIASQMRKSYGRGSTMSRPSVRYRDSVRYRASAMSTSSGPAPTPAAPPGPAPTPAARAGPTNASDTVSKHPPSQMPLPLPIVHGPIKKKKQRSSIPSIKPTIYISKKNRKVKESSLDTILKQKFASLYLKKFGSDPLPMDMTSITSVDSVAKPVENDWGFMKLPKLPSSILWKLSSSIHEPSYEIFENFLNKHPPIDVEQHVHDFMTNNNINFDMFDTFPRNWPLPFESKLVRRMRSEKRKCLILPKTSRKPKKTEKTRRKRVYQEPKTEPELLKVPSCEICRNFNQTEPDQPYMIEMKKRQACDELKRYYRQRLMAQSPNPCAPENPCVHFGSQPELNDMEEKLRQFRDELKRYRRRSPTESQSARGIAPDEPFVCLSSTPEPNMIEMRKQQVRDELKTHYSRRLSTSSSQMASDCSPQKPCVHFDAQTEPSSRHKQAESLRPSQVHLNWQPKQIGMHKQKQTMRQKLVECYKMLCDCETLLDKKLKQIKDDKRCL